jgi:hypothetical protein
MIGLGASTVSAATNQFRGVNRADPGDNFQSGVLYISGLTSTDTYASASAIADKVMSQFVTKLGANSVRLPINEATASQYWSTYTGVIDKILTMGKVLLCYWGPAHGAAPANMTNYWNMWTTVVNKYGGDTNFYFEIYNEPNMYNQTDLCNLYYSWITKFPSVPQSRVILDGTGMAQNVPQVGSDGRLSNCLLAVHEYTMFVGTSYTTEAQWETHFQGEAGTYANRTVCTEWGAGMSPGSKNGINYGYNNYDSTSPNNYFEAYVRGISIQLRTWKMGSFYWAGLKDGDWYSMTTKSGTGSNITLSVPNQSGLDRLHYSWADTIAVAVAPIDKKAAPASDFKATVNESIVRIEFMAPQSGLSSMKILNLNGKTMKTMAFRTKAGEIYSHSFDLVGIPEGFYIVTIENKGTIINRSTILLTRY